MCVEELLQVKGEIEGGEGRQKEKTNSARIPFLLRVGPAIGNREGEQLL